MFLAIEHWGTPPVISSNSDECPLSETYCLQLFK